MKKVIGALALAAALSLSVGAAKAVTASDASATVLNACGTTPIPPGCASAIGTLLNQIGLFDNRRAIGRAIAQAAQELGIEEEIDSILSAQGNSAVLEGFDSEIGTAAIGGDPTGQPPGDFGPDETSDITSPTGASTLGTNDNDGGEGSPG